MYFDLANVLVYACVAALFIAVALTAGRIIRPHHPTPRKLEVYECGEEAIGPAWIQFNVRFYVIALIFLIFDVEIAILFPWVTIFKEAGLLAFLEIMFFVGILAVGFAYVWRKGDLAWLKSITERAKETHRRRDDANPEEMKGGGTP